MAKSPIFGMGRNLRHRPLYSKRHPAAANVNMRGKKEKSMRCGCCFCIDLRDKLVRQQHMQEINNGADN